MALTYGSRYYTAPLQLWNPPVPGFRDYLADVNHDEKVNIIDALLIAQYIVNLIPSL